MGRDRSRSRSRSRRSRSRDRRRSRSTSRRRSRSRDRRKRSRSRDRRRGDERRRSRSRSAERHHHRRPDDKQAARLAKLQAWKSKSQAEQPLPQPSSTLQEDLARAQQIASTAAAAAAATAPVPQDEEDEEEDPLDAFMAAEVLPEVQARQEAERLAAEEEHRVLQDLLAKGKIPKALEDLIRDEEEETPDLVLEIPANKVKLVIGPGGERVKLIQKRTKCRVQHAKDEADLGRGFGVAAAPAAAAAAHAAEGSAPGGKTVKLHLFGNAEACEAARAMIMESIDNREQKAKQRAKEYEKKRETKRGERQIYHLRHARDYEILGLPLGASKAEAKVAFRKLALKWHPDKNRDNLEEAEKKFQEISQAYESLMSTDEDQRIEQLGGS